MRFIWNLIGPCTLDKSRPEPRTCPESCFGRWGTTSKITTCCACRCFWSKKVAGLSLGLHALQRIVLKLPTNSLRFTDLHRGIIPANLTLKCLIFHCNWRLPSEWSAMLASRTKITWPSSLKLTKDAPRRPSNWHRQRKGVFSRSSEKYFAK